MTEQQARTMTLLVVLAPQLTMTGAICVAAAYVAINILCSPAVADGLARIWQHITRSR